VIRAVLFDLGGTLADYYGRAEWPGVLTECLTAATAHLEARGALGVDPADVRAGLEAEQAEESSRLKGRDWRVYPLEDRLASAYFPGGNGAAAAHLDGLCRAFLGPVFTRGRLLPGALETVDALRARGLRLAIVSNMPWGAPRAPWEEEVGRLGLLPRIPTFLTCRDVGWRKPDRRIFDLAAARVGVPAAECLFVGDEPVWDYDGAAGAGMQPVLIDPAGRHAGESLRSIGHLSELAALI
jgi:putative hydrolase of the HAD superfamily